MSKMIPVEKSPAQKAADLLRTDPIFSYNEGHVIAELIEYLLTTYGGHYTTDTDDGLQTIDIWEAKGTLSSTAIDTAIKYLMRYGKKSGYNKKDLQKTMHYTILSLYAHAKLSGSEASDQIGE